MIIDDETTTNGIAGNGPGPPEPSAAMERPTVMMRIRQSMPAMLTIAALAAGCGGQAGPGPGQADRPTSSSATMAGAGATGATATTAGAGTTGTAGGAGTGGAPGTAPRTDPPGSIHVSGTVYAGVEPGCLLLDASQSQPYLLIDGDPAVLRPGTRVEVVGMLVDNVMSTCQQGRPLSVISATPV